MVAQIASNMRLPRTEEAWKKLSFWKKIVVNTGGIVSVGMYQPLGHSGPTECFIFRCGRTRKLNIDLEHTNGVYCSCCD